MYLALRDLAHAKGRFALIGAVMALITLLVVMLTGLAAGLGRDSVAAISSLSQRGVGQVAFSSSPKGQQVGFDSSRITGADVATLERRSGVQSVSPLTILQTRADVQGVPSPVSVFVVPAGSFAAPPGVKDGSVVVGTSLAKNVELAPGESITVGDKKVRVASLSGDASYQHMAVVWMTDGDARAAGVLTQDGGTTVALLRTGAGFDAGSLERATGIRAMVPAGSLATIASYESEKGSLTLMRVMLMLVSALVVGAFFTVWTIQRTPDLAVLKAIGASTSYLVRDALGQAGLLLLAGGGIGTLLAALAGLYARRVVPFVVSMSTTIVPLALLALLGLLGALVSLRRIAAVDPTTALGAAR